MESLVEVQRNHQEERERCIDMMVKESTSEKRSVFFITLVLIKFCFFYSKKKK